MNFETGSVIQMQLPAQPVRMVARDSRDAYLRQQQLILTARLQQLQSQAKVNRELLAALLTDLNRVQRQLAG
ncbi:hypothetical protein [Lactiplantibacillus songbeiensis]|uniref:Uncharacterized protein n=1 Tax=Lactiplantibacillus songbeiensis TaxID=2559920 RepID=A0ABW4C262_9LACO|nr:hypothetical protein [Lactiplantibacillus songbeiensis]